MSAAPFMQLYVADYLADTLHLTTEQHGAYLLLLMTMWRHDASLPNDPAKLARIARVSPKRWPAIWSEIGVFFEVVDQQITNKRLTKEHQKAVSISQERKTAGKKGGEAKALKTRGETVASATDLPPALPQHGQISDIIKIVSPNGDTGELAKVVDLYNAAAGRTGWPKVQRMTKPRFSALRQRLADAGGLDGWRDALERAEASDFLCGRSSKPFMASFDFLTNAKNFTKLMEGNYDNRTGNQGAPRRSGMVDAFAAVAAQRSGHA